jgi:glycosyltransferase involved in cell wall biosynthesis
MNKKFTILTANYNAGKYLKEWGDSILSQKYRPLEVVFVEDRSKDDSLKIIKKIAEDFKKNNIDFKLILPNKKLYCGSAYNLALEKATGNYFGVLDSDDMLESFACEFIVDIYERYPEISWIYTQYNKYNRKMDRVIKRGFCRYPGNGKSMLQMERKNINTYGHWRTFSDRISSFKNLFGKGLKCCVDKNLGFRLEEEGRGMFVDKVCYRYRTRSKGEKSIVHVYPLTKIRERVSISAKNRRKNKKIYSISRYKDIKNEEK